uniref:Uncharacterized protein n=1 Tax=Tanacetum cinerariifolium TaxID=118510 RepID=A0A6L2P3Q2_TANCI|nr:hypothetical protein [Tanacetum cinerariifolium]
MGELTFFLGLQVKQKKEGIFISQDKYVAEILKEFGFLDVKKASTLMETSKPFLKDEDGEEVDVHMYRSMIDSLMYLTSSRLDIMFVTMVANSTTKAEYVATSSCCGRVLWIQNPLLDYGVNADIDVVKVSAVNTPQMVINSPCLTNKKELAIPGQTATGKELSNLLMAGSLPKSTLPTKLIKTVNDDVLLQALINGKKVVITEVSIRHDLKLNDAEGTSCLPNVHYGICNHMPSNNQKFNFSKYILDNLKKNLEAGVPFYMFPRFIQVFVNHQIGDMSHHKGVYVNPSLTKKVFANMKRVGIGFSRAVTPLFGTMMVQDVKEVGDLPTAVQDIPIPDASSSSQHKRKHNPRKKEKKETEVSPTELHIEDHVPTTSNDQLLSGEDRMQLKELMVLCIICKIRFLTWKMSLEYEDVTDADVKEVAEEMVEVNTTAKIIVDEVSTACGELNAANEEPVSAALINITTAQPSEATKIIVDITTAPKAKGIVFHDMEESKTRTTSLKS